MAYLLLLGLVAVIGMAATISIQLGAAASRRDAEQALLAVGDEIDRAVRDFRSAHGRGPSTLEDLLGVDQAGGARRRLRKLYHDPLTGSAQWVTVRAPDGGIVCVHSGAEGRPIKQAGFKVRYRSFETASSYSGWCFGRA